MRSVKHRVLRVSALTCALLVPSFAAGPAPAEKPSLTIEKLIADGWEVAATFPPGKTVR
jgi:hypothetical protein